MGAAFAAAALVWLALGALVASTGGPIALLRVTVEPALGVARKIRARVPRSGTHLRAELRYARASYRCWRRGY